MLAAIKGSFLSIDQISGPPICFCKYFWRERATCQAFLATLPGFVQAAVFGRADGQNPFNFVSKVAWESADAIEGAKEAINARLEAAGLNVPEMRARLGVEADTAIYAEISQIAPCEWQALPRSTRASGDLGFPISRCRL